MRASVDEGLGRPLGLHDLVVVLVNDVKQHRLQDRETDKTTTSLSLSLGLVSLDNRDKDGLITI